MRIVEGKQGNVNTKMNFTRTKSTSYQENSLKSKFWHTVEKNITIE